MCQGYRSALVPRLIARSLERLGSSSTEEVNPACFVSRYAPEDSVLSNTAEHAKSGRQVGSTGSKKETKVLPGPGSLSCPLQSENISKKIC